MSRIETAPVLLAHGLLQDPGAVPLVIAVAGHRDPRPEFLPLLKQNFRHQLEQLIRELPHTPLLMLNGLAEGMDSEAAEIFLDVIRADKERRGREVPKHQLVAALPKIPADYRGDFEDPTSLARMEDLLQCCDGILHPGNCADLRVSQLTAGNEQGRDPSACYGQQGIFLVRHCYLLFGFFDGIETRLVGGTSQTVSMQRGEIHPLFVSVDEVLANKEPGALVLHRTPRCKHGSPVKGAGEVQFWSPGEARNKGSRGDGLDLPQTMLAIPNRLESINKSLGWPGFEPTIYNPAEGPYTRLWSRADQRAGKNKRNYEHWCRVLVATGFILVLLAQLSPVAQGLWWALLLLAFLLFPRLQQGPKLEFISQRCLSECLTVQHLWIALDIDDDAADLFHSRSNSELGWIRTVLRAVRIQLLSFHSREARIYSSAIGKAQIWIAGQIDFLTEKIKMFVALTQRWRAIAIVLAGSAVALATLESLPGSSGALAPWVVVLLAGFASALAYSNLIGYAETADRYKRSLRQFERGQTALVVTASDEDEEPVTTRTRQRIVIEALGREKLDELNDWVAGQLQRVYAPGA